MNRRGNRGVTLFETMLAASILAIAAASAALPFAAGVQEVQQSARLEQAVLLAESLMEEVVSRPFEDPQSPTSRTLGPEAGETDRTKFDNIDDYHGYSESDQVLRELTTTLTPINATNGAGLWRSVTVQYATLSGQLAWDTNNAALVTVTVNDGSLGAIYTLSRLVVREY